MFIYGYAYAGEEGKAGFRPEGMTKSQVTAQKYIASKLHVENHKDIDFLFSGKKFRAHYQGRPTGYIYFALPGTVYGLFHSDLLTKPISVGTLEEVQEIARRKAKQFVTHNLGMELKGVKFVKKNGIQEVHTDECSSFSCCNLYIVALA
jgi:hypothetical protein